LEPRIIRAGVAFALFVFGLLAVPLLAQSSRSLNVDGGALAVHGYDVVAYVTDAGAVRGRPEFNYQWQGAVWRFASAAHRDAFAREPERYVPQFGGYCAWAVSRGYTADIDPEAWRIVDGKLYLNYSKRVQRMWEQDIPGNIAKAVANWPAVLAK
jgi:YHS domain-containing protein